MKKILSVLVFSLLAAGATPAHAATSSRIDSAPGQSQSDWEASDVYRAFICPEGYLRGVGVDLNFTTDRSDDKQFVTCDQPIVIASETSTAPSSTPASETSTAPSSTPAPETSTAPSSTPAPETSTTSSNSQIRVGIWLISGRTSEIYGRGDGVADSQNQIQWVTCLESLSGPMLYPNRDNLNYIYTVTGPDGVVATGEYAPTWIDSMSSCTGNNGSNNYTIAYNLTGLKSGASYQFTINGSIAGSSFTASKSFTTMNALSISPTITSSSPDSRTVTTSPSSDSRTVTTTPTSLVPTQSDTLTTTSAPSSGSVETATARAFIAFETTTVVIPVPTPATDNDLSDLDEIVPEEEIIDSIDAVVQSNGTTRIEVSTGYSATAMRVVATKKGSKKRFTYRITTNSDGDRRFRAGLNLRGYTLVLFRGSTELDRVFVSQP